MGNCCLNYLTVTGEKSDLIRFDKCFKEKGIEFNVEVHELTDAGFTHFDFSSYLCYWHQKITHGYKLVGLVSVDQKTDYSFSAFIPPSISYLKTWKDWQFAHWSTRSDLYGMTVNWLDNNCVQYHFKTHWEAPTPVIVQMLLDFYMLDFEFKYVEDCQSFAGLIKSKDGEIERSDFKTATEGDFRDFLRNDFGYDFFKCPSCSKLLQEHEAESDSCPFCHTKITFNDDDELVLLSDDDDNDNGGVSRE